MNSNTKDTLIGLQLLGLNLDTGISPAICVKELESLTSIRQVSNGSKVIRRDCPVFSKLKYDMTYGDNGEILYYVFKGYKSSNDLVTEYSKDILRIKSKIESLESCVVDLEFMTLDVLTQDHFTYSKEDLF